MDRYKTLRTALWLSALLDALIVAVVVLKASRVGVEGLSAWLRHVHLVAVSATNGQATYQLQPDYRFTALYVGAVLGAFVLTFFLLRVYLRNRSGNVHAGGGHRYDAPDARSL